MGAATCLISINHMVVQEIMLREFIGMLLLQDSAIIRKRSAPINSKTVDEEADMEQYNLEMTGLWIAILEEIQNGHGIIILTLLIMVHPMVQVLMVHRISLETSTTRNMHK